MSYLSEVDGVDVTDQQAVRLNKAAFADVDIHLYPPLRTHFLIHAIQFQHPVPSEQSMLRAERRNIRFELYSAKQGKATCRPQKRGFAVPAKHGPQPAKRCRRWKRQPPSSPVLINKMSILGTIAMSFPGTPGFVGLPSSPMAGFPTMPLGLRPMGAFPSPIPMMSHPMGAFPSRIPMMPHPMVMASPASCRLFALTARPAGLVAPPSAAKERGKGAKEPNKAFKVRSPEQIVLKCARTACRAEMENWRAEARPNIADQFKQQVPIYFAKKKASQKRRRLEKHELIKKNRKELVKIYGSAVFNSGWPISRSEIREALGLKAEREQAGLEGLSELMEEEQATAVEEKIEQNTKSQEQEAIMEAHSGEGRRQDPYLQLFLLKREGEGCLVPQFVCTS